MGITGRYDFKGIQKAARVAIDAVLATTTWGIWLAKSAFAPAIGVIEDFIVNWLANHGLIIINVGLNIVDGVVDQKRMDAALDAGIKRVMQGRDKITPAEGKKIDDDVRKAFDENADLGAERDVTGSVPKLPGPSV